jgi:hypothetical protein
MTNHIQKNILKNISDQNILNIDEDIKNKFKEDRDKLEEYIDKLNSVNKTLTFDNLPKRIKDNLLESSEKLSLKIKDIKNRSSESFYISETAYYLEEYKQILKIPIKLNFMGKKIDTHSIDKKDEITEKYIDVANKYIPLLALSKSTNNSELKIECIHCNNKKNFDIIDNYVYVCIDCGNQIEVFLYTMSYKDTDRVNISAKYTYDRKVHFRDCINQYQGKQNSTIEPKVYEDLTREFDNHHLLLNRSDKKERYSKITKDNVLMFLKELQYTKHYENVNLIHYNFTGIHPPDLSHIEDKLLDDFDILTDLYDKRYKCDKKIDRKNFINTQYVLYQFLNRHKFPCKKEDFNILKTIDRKSFHDDICIGLFAELGWNFCHTF